jgi:hypothetical protein
VQEVKTPSWLLTRPAVYAGVVIVVLVALAIWFRAHDARVRREAVAAAHVKEIERARVKQDSIIAVRDDSLAAARSNTDTVTVTVRAAASSYARQRAQIDTAAPQPIGVPRGMVVVSTAFVAAADSLARLVPQLLTTIATERAASDLRIQAGDSARALLISEVAQLKLEVAAVRPSWSGRIKDAAIGGAIIAAGIAILKK